MKFRILFVLILFFARVLTARAPIVDLHAFVNRNFAVGSLFGKSDPVRQVLGLLGIRYL